MLLKYVLTGGPCSGKTTLVNELRKKGFPVLSESAREILSSNNHKYKNNYEKLERDIFLHQLKKESKLCRKPGVYFLDRGTLDCLAYSKLLLGYVPKEIAEHPHHERYHKVFVLERLPFIDDGLRIEKDDAEAQKIHDTLVETYVSYGYNPIHVPVMPIEDRLDFILSHITTNIK